LSVKKGGQKCPPFLFSSQFSKLIEKSPWLVMFVLLLLIEENIKNLHAT